MKALSISAVAMAFALPLMFGAANAQQAAQPGMQTQMQDQMAVETLSPSLQQAVTGRMAADQQLSELVETTILNSLMAQHFDVRNFQRVGNAYQAEVLQEDGNWTTVTVDPSTYEAG